jgi:hypothetical protein
MAVKLELGETIRRVDLHQMYGGRRQGGISPSKVSDNVFLFTDPVTGRRHGYLYDGWRDGDDYYHYTGEGQFGDQQMAQGNRAIRDHVDEARELHLFEVHDGVAGYKGQFEYVDDYLADAPESGGGDTRSVIVFRLRPLNTQPEPSQSRLDRLGSQRVKEVPVEQHLTEKMVINPSDQPREAERREQKLVQEFLAHLTLTEGHEVCRLQFRPDDEPAPIFCDLFDKTDRVVYEAKGTVARPAFRMAIGQLADYCRLVDPPTRKALLVPQRPRPDLLDLAASQGVSVVWPNGQGFVTLEP